MSLFKDIAKQTLLLELTDSQERDKDIENAINNVLRVRIGYDDEQGGKGKNLRYILPVAFGLSKSGNKVIRAYQPSGSSKRGVPNWKLFRMDRIYSWDNGKKTFKDYKDKLIDLGLNTHGDNSMTKLFAITPFANDDVQVADTTTQIGPNPVVKADINPTNKLQNPTINKDKENFTPSGVINQQKPIDKTAPTSYFKDKAEAPDTKPVYKQDVNPQDVQPTEPNVGPETGKIESPATEPVTRDDIQNNEFTRTYRDLTDRMNNLYKDNEEENEEGEE